MPRPVAVWHGTDEDLKALQAACNANCECTLKQVTCSAHQLMTDQATLDRLNFVKRTFESSAPTDNA